MRFETRNHPTPATPEAAAVQADAEPEAQTTPPASNENDADGGIRMQVRKRSGELENVDLNKIVRAVSRCANGLSDIDPIRVATRTISGLYDGASTSELDELSIQTAASLMAEEPQYSFLAARLLGTYIDKEVQNQEIYSFSQSIRSGYELGSDLIEYLRVCYGQLAETQRCDATRAQRAFPILRSSNSL